MVLGTWIFFPVNLVTTALAMGLLSLGQGAQTSPHVGKLRANWNREKRSPTEKELKKSPQTKTR